MVDEQTNPPEPDLCSAPDMRTHQNASLTVLSSSGAGGVCGVDGTVGGT